LINSDGTFNHTPFNNFPWLCLSVQVFKPFLVWYIGFIGYLIGTIDKTRNARNPSDKINIPSFKIARLNEAPRDFNPSLSKIESEILEAAYFYFLPHHFGGFRWIKS